jgi:hypothetical protein
MATIGGPENSSWCLVVFFPTRQTEQAACCCKLIMCINIIFLHLINIPVFYNKYLYNNAFD